ncbi:sensor histidine kinase [Undibacterium sp. SXout20W]|uniref:sensor histidine kinase n=1 Tax=Undibacterium sp. SXout20W TaxID=3413051 RepID=UPI003BF1A014
MNQRPEINSEHKQSTPNDAPLAANIIRKEVFWYARAQQYPIFSVTWYKYRVLSYLIPVVLLILFLLLMTQSIKNASSSWKIAVLVLAISIVINLFLGRGLAVLVCRTKWSQQKMAIGVVLSIVFGFGLSSSLYFFSKGIEQKRIIEIQNNGTNSANEEFEKLENSMEKNDFVYIPMLAFHFILYAWLAGFPDLWAYFKQQKTIKDALTEQQLEKYKIERNEAEMRLSLLASQIEPHFLFNTLSGVRSAILSDPQKGVAIIDHLAEYLRYTIPEIRHDGVTPQVRLANQFNAIRAYLGVIQHRIPRLTFFTHYTETLSEQLIPPLMLISLVENAVKHGVELKKGPVHIEVNAKEIVVDSKAYLQLIVSDNGLGFSNVTSGTGIGLTNIRERLRQLYGNEAVLLLTTNEEGGISASIRLPIFSVDKSSVHFLS